MSFETFFRLISYAAVFCGFLSLWVSGSFGMIATTLFIAVIIGAWFLEDTRWQISEKLGTVLIVLALPAFILAWKFQVFLLFDVGDTAVAGILARLILTLSAIKLLQQKSSRDWVFLYLMSFFQVMLAAGLSISGLYLLSFLLYLLVMVCAIIAHEIRKTAICVSRSASGPEATRSRITIPPGRLPATSVILILFIALIALPLFFMLPRVGGAGFGGNLSTRSGFSDTVRLGGVGLIQENDAVVMRVKLDKEPNPGELYFRGIALDTFDNLAWSRSKAGIKEPFATDKSDIIQIDTAASRNELSLQTIYLEPLDSPVLFALPKAVMVQGGFPIIYKDLYGAVSFPQTPERVSYKVLSDRSLPSPQRLRSDAKPYSAAESNYRQLPPVFDLRIAELAEQITANSTNRYDKAKAVETYLRTSFGYTLQRKASGREPLADFLFNVREGHCEYFATAMAVMLRTQGMATRIVNGFHGGEYNDAAGVTIVRQRNAHAWVEVYFPATDSWVPFDPTPAAGLNAGSFGSGLSGTLRKYAEALETFWIQYFVAFDNQEQRSLARAVRNGMAEMQVSSSAYLSVISEIARSWWDEVRGAEGAEARAYALGQAAASVIGLIAGFFVLRWLIRRLGGLTMWKRLRGAGDSPPPAIIGFYQRMQDLLAERGIVRDPHQTPLEFAAELNSPEALMITDKYNRVRFGDANVTQDEADQIDRWLSRLADPYPPA